MNRNFRRWPSLLAAWIFIVPFAIGEDVRPTENPFLWRIHPAVEGGASSFLYGTMHVGDPRILALPQVVEDALYDSQALFTELAFDTMMSEIAAGMFLPKGETLRDKLPPELYARIETLMKERGTPMKAFDTMQVWAFHLVLQTLDFQEQMMAGQPLDMFLYTEAKTMGMDVGGLETVEEQISVFRDFAPDDQIKLLTATVDAYEQAQVEGTNAAEEMVLAYLSGSDDALFLLLEEGSDDPLQAELMDKLLTDRNIRMADRIDAKLKAAPQTQFFFAVGAAHMPAKLGLVQLLTDKGYRVERIGGPKEPTIRDLLIEIRGLRDDVDSLRIRLDKLEKRRFF